MPTIPKNPPPISPFREGFQVKHLPSEQSQFIPFQDLTEKQQVIASILDQHGLFLNGIVENKDRTVKSVSIGFKEGVETGSGIGNRQIIDQAFAVVEKETGLKLSKLENLGSSGIVWITLESS